MTVAGAFLNANSAPPCLSLRFISAASSSLRSFHDAGGRAGIDDGGDCSDRARQTDCPAATQRRRPMRSGRDMPIASVDPRTGTSRYLQAKIIKKDKTHKLRPGWYLPGEQTVNPGD